MKSQNPSYFGQDLLMLGKAMVKISVLFFLSWRITAFLGDPPLRHVATFPTLNGSVEILGISFGRDHRYIVDPLRLHSFREALPVQAAPYFPYGQISLRAEDGSIVIWTRYREAGSRPARRWRFLLIDKDGGEFDVGCPAASTMRVGKSEIQGWKIPALRSCKEPVNVRLLEPDSAEVWKTLGEFCVSTGKAAYARQERHWKRSL